jgi:hypothetical protein
MKYEPIEKRFWKKVNVGDGEECWEWTAGKASGRYGSLSVSRGSGKVLAHRFSWELHNKKKVPNGLYVCHSCDNPLCVNPAHLFLGTQSDNVKDMWSKGRNNKSGEKNGRSKLTRQVVVKIRDEYTGRRGQIVSLATKHGVGSSTIFDVVNHRSWTHI